MTGAAGSEGEMVSISAKELHDLRSTKIALPIEQRRHSEARRRIHELERAEDMAALIEDRARFPDRPDDIGRMIEAHIGNLKAGKVSAEEHARNLSGRLHKAATEIDRATRLIRTWCNAAPESPGCLYPGCDCGKGT